MLNVQPDDIEGDVKLIHLLHDRRDVSLVIVVPSTLVVRQGKQRRNLSVSLGRGKSEKSGSYIVPVSAAYWWKTFLGEGPTKRKRSMTPDSAIQCVSACGICLPSSAAPSSNTDSNLRIKLPMPYAVECAETPLSGPRTVVVLSL